MRKLTTEEWIAKAKLVHGDVYDYSKTVYKTSREKLIITCKIHGDFLQNPGDHTQGNGCIDCANKRKITKKDFLIRAVALHSNKYDYSKINLINNKTKIEIICPVHGSFWQTPDHHLNRKQGCIRCSGRNKTKEEFLEEVKEIHGNTYGYDMINYVNTVTPIQIICKKHGAFWQTPRSHKKGQGCPKCGVIKSSETQKGTIEEFIQKALKVHNNKYDYSKSIYQGVDKSIIIVCPIHGEFTQTPYVHSKGHGCPHCTKHGFDRNKPAYLYYLKVITNSGKILYKIGITNRTVNERFQLTDLDKIEIIKQKLYNKGQEALDWETKLKQLYKRFQYKGPNILSSGNTELFTEDIIAMYYKENKLS